MNDITVLCDRCFEDVIEKRKFYKLGSCNYCEKCYEKIRKEFEREELSRIVLENYRKMNDKSRFKNELKLFEFFTEAIDSKSDHEFFETMTRFA